MKTVIVTGGNRGIGLEICRQLDEKGFRVILGSRNYVNGKIASEGFSKNVIVEQLDVASEDSIKRFFEFVKYEIKSVDVLINNAGIGENNVSPAINGIKRALKNNFHVPYMLMKRVRNMLQDEGIAPARNASNVPLDDVRRIMDTNFYGAWRMIQYFAPLLSKSAGGRIINISSGMGELNSLNGYYPAYRLSKVSLNALTIMFANELIERNVKVNAVCPGWVKTDMGGPDAPLSLREGADTAVWLATAEVIPTGKFFRDREIINW